MVEGKGFAKFEPPKKASEKMVEIDVGTIRVDGKIKRTIERVFKKFSDKEKYGALALRNVGDAVTVLLEEFVSNRKKKRRRRKSN